MNLIYGSSQPYSAIGYKRILEICEDMEKKLDIRLSKSQKLILLERGTLEGLLTVLQGEPIEVHIIEQGMYEGKYVRKVSLKGSRSREELVKARSTVYLGRMDDQVAEDIKSGHLGIGEILTKHNIESKRDFREIGYDEKTRSLFRIYDINVRETAWFTVKEIFSISLYSTGDRL